MRQHRTFFKFAFVVALCLFIQNAHAQVIINTTTYTSPTAAQSLVNNVLLGQGVTASNIVFTPAANSTTQLGYFKGSNSNLGLDSGVVLSTGNVADINPNNVIGGVGNFSPMTYPDLLSVANSVPPLIGQTFSVSGVYDVAVLEFDFVPASDTVKFRYVFASDEYQTWINSSYNDVFGFFISGPGINGPYSGNSMNIASVPFSSPPLPITISSVQPALNGQYYIDNPNNTTVGFNGFTKVFTAMALVTCGQTYHIRLAIADGSDSSLDSGVFLEANSFSSQGVQVSSTVSVGGNDSILYEGCGMATISLTRPGDVTLGDTVHFIVSGSPNNFDYFGFADSVVFLPGQATALINITAHQDNLVEGLDTITLTTISGLCSTLITSITIYISDVPPIYANAGNDTLLRCAGDPATLHASATGGLTGYFYTWLNGVGNSRIITVNPTVTTDYIVMIQDTCQQVVDYDTITVHVPVVSPIVVTASENQDIVCPNQPATFTASAIGGTQPYTFMWQNPPTAGNTATFITPHDQWYVIEVTDVCNILHGYDTVIVNLIEVNPLTVFLPEELDICLGEIATAEALTFGGVKDYKYTWDNVVSDEPVISVSPINKSIYVVHVTDSCGSETSASVEVNILFPEAEFNYAADPKDDYRIHFDNVSINPVLNYWDFADGEFSSDFSPEHVYGDSGNYDVQLIMTDDKGCTDTVKNIVWVNPDLRVLIPSAFTPNNDGLNDLWEINGQGMQELTLIIFDRWGKKVYDNAGSVSNNKWDGKTASGKDMPQGAYAFTISAKSFSGKLYRNTGTFTLIR